ncbi:MAG TPA: 6-phosphogluconolactonase [Candidatus Limnocylindrales bacterium]|nr:6-phosphogluconolactonase [Candidatus Limnocylindrales bacterium]
MTRRFEILPDVDAVAAATADRLVAAGRNAIRRRGRFILALSGGSTPLAVCPLLVVPPRVRMLDWSRVQFFFGDERAVPPDDPESNYHTARLALLDYLPRVNMEQVHRMPCDLDDLDAGAHLYERQMRRVIGGEPFPVFDLIWLGMGPDGHTASLFPGSAGLEERRRWVVAHHAPGPDAWRMTLTFPVLNAAREAMFVVTGAEKADALREIRSGSRALPAGRVNARRTLWLVDAAAAGE